VATADDWREAALRIRQDKAKHLPRLYELALEDGPRLLARFQRRLGDERIVDLVHDLLATKADAIIEADEPRALFCTALQRRAISWLRRGDAAVASERPERGAEHEDEGERQRFLVDARAALDGLTPRERAMAVAVALGEEREAVAREFKTTRANVDQILSRIRRKFADKDV
jgi:DNA-directed RNA polymerase specialized sigma24 family protein